MAQYPPLFTRIHLDVTKIVPGLGRPLKYVGLCKEVLKKLKRSFFSMQNIFRAETWQITGANG